MKHRETRRKVLEGRKDLKVFGKVDVVDWDGNTSQPSYLLKDVQVYDNDEKLVSFDHMWFYTDEPLDKVEQKTIISFIGDAYHYGKKEGDNYSIRPKSNISVLKVLKEKVKISRWYLKKAH